MNDASKALYDIAVLAESDLPLKDFLVRLDSFNQHQLSTLKEVCSSERHAKALLLKLSNIAIGKFQYRKRHTRLTAKPFGLVVDSCNSCPLSCPGCIHRRNSTNPENIAWESGVLGIATFEALLNRYGAYAISTRLFNWGEPLLNKKTPAFVEASRRFLMRVSLSSNLSVQFDPDALVSSGLDYLIMSIDGATQETYQKYRKGGNFSLVLENVRRLVDAKKRLNSYTPYLVWQYLVFDHNLGEMDQALHMAKELGVNEVNFGEPNSVSFFDPR